MPRHMAASPKSVVHVRVFRKYRAHAPPKAKEIRPNQPIPFRPMRASHARFQIAEKPSPIARRYLRTPRAMTFLRGLCALADGGAGGLAEGDAAVVGGDTAVDQDVEAGS